MELTLFSFGLAFTSDYLLVYREYSNVILQLKHLERLHDSVSAHVQMLVRNFSKTF